MVKKQLFPYSPEGCFIATAVYSDTGELYKLDVIREFRDAVLKKTAAGQKLVNVYYIVSPRIANYIRTKSLTKTVVKVLVVEPGYCISSFVMFTRNILKNILRKHLK